jgi:hypothetical protein
MPTAGPASGCKYALVSSETSLSAAQKAPTRAFDSTSAQSVVCARIWEKKTGSLQLFRSHDSSSRRMHARLYAV